MGPVSAFGFLICGWMYPSLRPGAGGWPQQGSRWRVVTGGAMGRRLADRGPRSAAGGG
jgi:hypothetical protein